MTEKEINEVSDLLVEAYCVADSVDEVVKDFKGTHKPDIVLDGEIMAPYSGKYQLSVKAVIPKSMEKDFKFGEKVKVIIVKE